MKYFKISENKRDEYKIIILTALFSDENRLVINRFLKYFQQHFPQITNFILDIKTRYIGIKYNTFEYYKNLICLMQREESKFVIEYVVGEFIKKYEEEFISTIHDSIVVRTEMLPAAEKLMRECFINKGIQPKLKISLFKDIKPSTEKKKRKKRRKSKKRNKKQNKFISPYVPYYKLQKM